MLSPDTVMGFIPPKGFLCHCEESFFRKDDEAISSLSL
jgi:hypothetical protein